jgi:hypothetical protein
MVIRKKGDIKIYKPFESNKKPLIGKLIENLLFLE